MKSSILIIDDDIEVRSMVADVLEDESYQVHQADGWDTAKPILQDNEINLVFLDLWLQEGEYSGIDVLEKIKKKYPTIPVVMISGHGNIEIAVKAIKYGAYDFIEKPFVIERMLITAERAIESAALKYENVSLKRKKHGSDVVLIGSSQGMVKVRLQALKAAASNSFVCISSAKGGCAEDLAWLIHCNSSRKEHRFLIYDCKQANQHTLEETLFGTLIKKGAIRNANGGTLFLDNIGCMNEQNQKILLDFVRSNQIDGVELDTRIICNDYGEKNNVISELYERLSGIEMVLPPLSERMQDIEEIISYYYTNAFNIFGILEPPEMDSGAKTALVSYSWPGNITQLKNLLETLFLTIDKPTILPSDLPFEFTHNQDNISGTADYMGMSLRDAREAFERDYLQYQINRFNGNMTHVAQYVEIDRSSLYKKMKALNILNDENKQEVV